MLGQSVMHLCRQLSVNKESVCMRCREWILAAIHTAVRGTNARQIHCYSPALLSYFYQQGIHCVWYFPNLMYLHKHVMYGQIT